MRFLPFAASATLAAGLLGAPAFSASTPDTSRALKTLMDDGHGANDGHGKGHGHADGKGNQVTVVKGDTLAKILARVPDLMPPTRPQVFKAVVALNPHAFIGGNPNRLIAGAQLQLPEAEELHGLATGRMAKTGAKDHHGDSKSKEGSHKGGAYSHRDDPHAGWVRFPSR